MIYLRGTICIALLCLLGVNTYCQQPGTHRFSLIVSIEKGQPAEAATIKLQRDNSVIQTAASNNKGLASFGNIKAGNYTFLITYTGYKPQITRVY
jgi:iron complex outermembrane receptor protein